MHYPDDASLLHSNLFVESVSFGKDDEQFQLDLEDFKYVARPKFLPPACNLSGLDVAHVIVE